MTETTITFTSFDENDAEVTKTLPARWTVCLECAGDGYVVEYGVGISCWECDGTGEVAEVVTELADPAVLAEYDAMNKAVEIEDLTGLYADAV